ncbi:hypothetical protein GGS21DRAFT_45623 [Xylaria nigripes]|nr:hypothetical protein GGS21DRAFT_45623 [Xylaria nigripes]
MSYESRHRFTSRLDQPPEILLLILSHLGEMDCLHLAYSLPEIFLSPGFHIIRLDAEEEVKRQADQSWIPIVETEHRLPLLYTAIKHFPERVVEDIVREYKRVCPASIDGIWNGVSSDYPSPLTFAAELGKPSVVSILLNEGADHSLKYYSQRPGGMGAPQCTLAGHIHTECEYNADQVPIVTSICATAIDRTIKSANLVTEGIDKALHQNLEECAMLLYSRGARFRGGRIYTGLRTDGGFHASIYFPALVGFDRLCRVILDPIVHNVPPQGMEQFGMALYELIKSCLTAQKYDQENGIIKYLLSIGAPLADPRSDGRVHIDLNLASKALVAGKRRTAQLLFNEYTKRQIPLEYTHLIPQVRGSHWPYLITPDLRNSLHGTFPAGFIECVYRTMKNGNNLLSSEPANTVRLHKDLLRSVIVWGTTDGAEFLIRKGLADSSHMYLAILHEKMKIISLVIKSGISVNEPMELWNLPRFYPLHLAIKVKSLKIINLILDAGADTSLIPSSVWRSLDQRYRELKR